MNTQETLKPTKPVNVVPTAPVADPKKQKDEILESIAKDCLVNAEAFVKQSEAPEGE